ncbi:MAG: ATP synthase F1 subunit gamma, partial [bacterium]|nr:ATP synthase F1 subunit gamma [bacterium]
DKGLAGALNSNVIREMVRQVKQFSNVQIEYIAVGKKGRDFLRYTRREIVAIFDSIGDKPQYLATLPISGMVIDGFSMKEYDAVYVAYSHYVSTLVQKPVMKKLLPVELDITEDKKTKVNQVPLFEPSAEVILERLLPYYIEQTIYMAVLDSNASEHSARMMAMKNATDNAKEVQKSLQLQYNNARQAQITQQIAEIASATMI